MRGLAIALALTVAELGCGSRCAEVEADRLAFLARTGPPAPGPHIAIAMPFAILDAQLATRLAELPPIPLKLPGIDGLRIVPRTAVLTAAAPGHVGVHVSLEILDDDAVVASIAGELDATATWERHDNHVSLKLLPTQVSGVDLALIGDARAGLAAAIVRRLPAPLRLVAHVPYVDELAGQAASWLAGKSLDEVMGPKILERLQRLTQLNFTLGTHAAALPVASLDLSSTADQLLVTARLALPVSTALVETPLIPAADTARVQLSGGAVAALATWAISSGAVPGKFDGKWHPAKDGYMSAGIEWRAGKRPLALHVWRCKGPCMRAKIGASPHVSIGKDGKLDVQLTHTKIESVTGNLFVHARMMFYAVQFERDLIAHSELTIAGHRLGFTIAAASADAAGLAFDVRIVPD